jgi:hypothetical protein
MFTKLSFYYNCETKFRYVNSNFQVVLQTKGGGSENVACKSACEAFGSAQYCCSGEYGNPNTCKPSGYSQFFKNACPRAYSYAYDDATSTFTCAEANYIITFCPSTTRYVYIATFIVLLFSCWFVVGT